jgi:hypothetical protein
VVCEEPSSRQCAADCFTPGLVRLHWLCGSLEGKAWTWGSGGGVQEEQARRKKKEEEQDDIRLRKEQEELHASFEQEMSQTARARAPSSPNGRRVGALPY